MHTVKSIHKHKIQQTKHKFIIFFWNELKIMVVYYKKKDLLHILLVFTSIIFVE